MGLMLNHNIQALQTYNAVSATTETLRKSIGKLSSGLRVNSAADDAAGLAISEKMRAQIWGLDQAVRNSQDGISMIQTAEGALQEVHSMLQRMRELSVQAANDTLTQQDRAYIQTEVDQLVVEVDRIASTTQFNKKKLLDGSTSAVWSSDNLKTQAVIRGALSGRDQFGQKVSAEGNYRIVVKAKPGQAQIIKSNIMQTKYNSYLEIVPGEYPDNMQVQGAGSADELLDALLGDRTGIKSATVDTAKTELGQSAGTFSGMGAIGLDSGIVLSTGTATRLIGNNNSGSTTTDGTGINNDADLNDIAGYDTLDACILEFDLEVEDDVFALVFEYVFASEEYPEWVNRGKNDVFGFIVNGENVALAPGTKDPVTINSINVGANSQFYVDNAANKGANIIFDGYTTVLTAVVPVKPGANHVKLAIADGGDSAYNSSVLLNMKTIADTNTVPQTKPAFEQTVIKDVINEEMSYPKTLEIYQGDGKSASVTIYEDDTIASIEKKLNDAIGGALGQSTNGSGEFVSYVTGNPTTRIEVEELENGNKGVHVYYDYPDPGTGTETVPGTFVIRSAVPGLAGRLHFAGDKGLLDLFGFNTIQEASESDFTVSVYDAHTNMLIDPERQITGSTFYGAINGSVDIKFDPMAGIAASWDEDEKSFAFSPAGAYTTFLHLADNTATLQIGANEGEDFSMFFGSAGSEALGLDGVLVVSRETAARSITILDNAIDMVSRTRATLGAYQNRLEHTVANLTASSANLTASESRIRDTDMAKEMMNFTKLNIMLQGGVLMMAQANQLPQFLLSLLR